MQNILLGEGRLNVIPTILDSWASSRRFRGSGEGYSAYAVTMILVQPFRIWQIVSNMA